MLGVVSDSCDMPRFRMRFARDAGTAPKLKIKAPEPTRSKGLGRFGFQNGATLNLETERRPPEYMTGAEALEPPTALKPKVSSGHNFSDCRSKRLNYRPFSEGCSSRCVHSDPPGPFASRAPAVLIRRCRGLSVAFTEPVQQEKKQSLCYRLALEAFRRRWPTENPSW